MQSKKSLVFLLSVIIFLFSLVSYSQADLLDKRSAQGWQGKPKDLFVLGQAIQDIIYKFDDEEAYKKYLSQFDIRQGASNLVSKEVIMQVMRDLKSAKMQVGGSANNTAVGVAKFGHSVTFQAAIADDEMGKAYMQSMKQYNMQSITTVFDGDGSTGVIMVIVSPSGERTMLAHIGISKHIPIITSAKFISDYKVVFSEGYLLDSPEDRGNLLHDFFKIAKNAGSITVFTFGDQYVVKRHRQACKELARAVDIVFSDDQQIYELFKTDDWSKIKQATKEYNTIFVITFAERGAYILVKGKETYIPVQDVAKVVDSTGAGDQFAAGFLDGYIKGYDLTTCGNMGAKAAAEIIQKIGAKP